MGTEEEELERPLEQSESSEEDDSESDAERPLLADSSILQNLVAEATKVLNDPDATKEEVSNAVGSFVSLERQKQLLGTAESPTDQDPQISELLSALGEKFVDILIKDATDVLNDPDATKEEVSNAVGSFVSLERQKQLLGTEDPPLGQDPQISELLSGLGEKFVGILIKDATDVLNDPAATPEEIQQAAASFLSLERQKQLVGTADPPIDQDPEISAVLTGLGEKYKGVTGQSSTGTTTQAPGGTPSPEEPEDAAEQSGGQPWTSPGAGDQGGEPEPDDQSGPIDVNTADREVYGQVQGTDGTTNYGKYYEKDGKWYDENGNPVDEDTEEQLDAQFPEKDEDDEDDEDDDETDEKGYTPDDDEGAGADILAKHDELLSKLGLSGGGSSPPLDPGYADPPEPIPGEDGGGLVLDHGAFVDPLWDPNPIVEDSLEVDTSGPPPTGDPGYKDPPKPIPGSEEGGSGPLNPEYGGGTGPQEDEGASLAAELESGGLGAAPGGPDASGFGQGGELEGPGGLDQVGGEGPSLGDVGGSEGPAAPSLEEGSLSSAPQPEALAPVEEPEGLGAPPAPAAPAAPEEEELPEEG